MNRILENVLVSLLEKIATKKHKSGDKFNINTFKKLTVGEDGDILESIEQLILYAERYLTKTGEGSSRIVFILSSRYALKIAKRTAGMAQNKAELQAYQRTSVKNVISKIYQHDPLDRWLITDLVKPLSSEQEFKRLTGDEFSEFTFNIENYYKNDVSPEKESQLFDDVITLIEENNLEWGDLVDLWQWGQTPDGRAVVLDYGLTEEVYSDHYDHGPTDNSNVSATAKTKLAKTELR